VAGLSDMDPGNVEPKEMKSGNPRLALPGSLCMSLSLVLCQDSMWIPPYLEGLLLLVTEAWPYCFG
jgi:hypothetical protein